MKDMYKVIQDVSIGYNIQKVRMKQGFTQEQLVAKMQTAGSNMSRSTLANIEAGRRNIKVSDLRLIKEILQIDYEEILGE